MANAPTPTQVVDPALTSAIIGCAIQVHRALGPGLLESAYTRALAIELGRARLRFGLEQVLPASYEGIALGADYRVDLLVEEQVIVEVKSVARLTLVHEAQLRTYLRMSGLPVGLLMNFNVLVLRHGLRRMSL